MQYRTLDQNLMAAFPAALKEVEYLQSFDAREVREQTELERPWKHPR
jgi:hypothetical protein